MWIILVLPLLLLNGCYFLGAPMGIGDLEGLKDTHCIYSTFMIGGPPPGGKIEGEIRPRQPDGTCT